MKIVMLGAPGAGKGTQADRIVEKYKLPHISTGDIFRANLKQGTELGKKAKAYMDAGALVPDELVVDLVLDRIAQPDCEAGYILDGFPRTILQAESLDQALAAKGEGLDVALEVAVPDENIISRMSGRRSCECCGTPYHVVAFPSKVEGVCDKCGGALIQRADDKAETVANRLAVYHEQTEPLISYYEKNGKLRSVDGTMTMDAVFESIVQILGE